MINQFLHGLTNRKILSNLPNTVFASDPVFIPSSLSASDLALRSVLCLDNLETDYYLQIYAMLIEAYPDIKSVVQNSSTSYTVQDFLPWCVTCYGAKLLSNGSASGFFTDPAPSGLPLGLTYTISFVANSVCQILQVETGISVQANCQVSASPSSNLLRIDWPTNIPFQGVLSLNQPWVNGSLLTIITAPSQFPYAAAVELVTNQSYFLQLLLQFQLTEVFQNTIAPQDKLALILAVIARSNSNAYSLST